MGTHDNRVDMESTDKIGTRLRLARQGSGVKLTEQATKTGYTKGHLSSVENNRVPAPEGLVRSYERALEVQEGSLKKDFSSIPEDAPIPFSTQLEERLSTALPNIQDRKLAEEIILGTVDVISEAIKRSKNP